MFKRIFAFIIIIFFICFKCLTWVPSAAATGIPAFDAFYYAILQTLGMAYTNGVEMDLAPAIAEVRENVPDYLQQPDNALKYLLRDYAGKIWDNVIMQWSDSANDDATMANVAAIRLATDEISTPTLADIVAQYQKKALDSDYQITTPINTKSVSFWNRFDSLYINEYLEKINFDPDQVVIDYPDNYAQTVQRFSGFTALGTTTPNLKVFPFSTSATGGNIVTFYDFNNFSFVSGLYSRGYSIMPLLTINISSSDSGVTISYPNATAANVFMVNNSSYFGAFELRVNESYWNISDVYYINNPQNYNLSNFTSSFVSLNDAINYLFAHFSNINLFVDGVAWSYNGISTINFESSVPNAVIDDSSDDGKIISNPIYWVVDDNTGTPIDSQINLDKLIDYLKDVIDGSNTDTSINFGDLVDAGVIEKQDGTAITDENVISVPVADAIDDALADSDTIDTPITAIETLPPLPPLPPFFPTPNFPEGDPTSGFHGMSVLARIINITNQSLPSEVVLVFYGVVFGAVILGLIKILHK